MWLFTFCNDVVRFQDWFLKRRDNINNRTIYIPQPDGRQTVDVKEMSRRIEGM